MAEITSFTHKHHPQPRLSAGQVAEYLEANSTRRRRILQDAKFPGVAVLIPYADAKSAVVGHLSRGGESPLDGRLVGLRRKLDNPESTPFERRNCKLCIEAIETFQAKEAGLKVGKLVFSRPGFPVPKLKISDVSLSVSIDLLTEKPTRGGERARGAAMLVFTKTAASRRALPERCKAMSLLIYEALKAGSNLASLDPTLCMVIDVFDGAVYRAKGEQKLLLKTVGTSCEEVKNIWPTVPPPSKYNGPMFSRP